jgi:hypothetical protein
LYHHSEYSYVVSVYSDPKLLSSIPNIQRENDTYSSASGYEKNFSYPLSTKCSKPIGTKYKLKFKKNVNRARLTHSLIFRSLLTDNCYTVLVSLPLLCPSLAASCRLALSVARLCASFQVLRLYKTKYTLLLLAQNLLATFVKIYLNIYVTHRLLNAGTGTLAQCLLVP